MVYSNSLDVKKEGLPAGFIHMGFFFLSLAHIHTFLLKNDFYAYAGHQKNDSGEKNHNKNFSIVPITFSWLG